MTAFIDDLKPVEVPLDRLFLDPNNPRFLESIPAVPDNRIIDTKVQAKAEERMARFSVSELADSILRNGFLPLDRIVVRRLVVQDEQPAFVVLEGNRRLAALRQAWERVETSQIDPDEFTQDDIDALKEHLATISCLEYVGDDQSAAWILQGVRHISGVKDWTPAQRAELISKERDERNLSYKAIGETLGLQPQKVSSLYKAYRALRQMMDDEVYGKVAKKEYFTLFDEAVSKKNVREWLGWNPDGLTFSDTENARKFFAWISPDDDDEHTGLRRIHDPRQMASLDRILASEKRDELLEELDKHVPIDELKGRLEGESEQLDWHSELNRALAAVKGIPGTAFTNDPGELQDLLGQLEACVSDLIELANSAVKVTFSGNEN